MARLGAAYNIGFILGPFVGGVLAKPSRRADRLPDAAAGRLGLRRLLGHRHRAGGQGEPRAPASPRSIQPSRWVMFGFAARHPVVGRLMLLTFVGRLRLHRHRVHLRALGPAPVRLAAARRRPLLRHHRRRSRPSPVLADRRRCRAASARRGCWPLGMAGTVICMALQPFPTAAGSPCALMALMALSSSVAFPNSGALLSAASTRTTRARSWASTTPPAPWPASPGRWPRPGVRRDQRRRPVLSGRADRGPGDLPGALGRPRGAPRRPGSAGARRPCLCPALCLKERRFARTAWPKACQGGSCHAPPRKDGGPPAPMRNAEAEDEVGRQEALQDHRDRQDQGRRRRQAPPADQPQRQIHPPEPRDQGDGRVRHARPSRPTCPTACDRRS